jgi:hypothetical protein
MYRPTSVENGTPSFVGKYTSDTDRVWMITGGVVTGRAGKLRFVVIPVPPI